MSKRSIENTPITQTTRRETITVTPIIGSETPLHRLTRGRYGNEEYNVLGNRLAQSKHGWGNSAGRAENRLRANNSYEAMSKAQSPSNPGKGCFKALKLFSFTSSTELIPNRTYRCNESISDPINHCNRWS